MTKKSKAASILAAVLMTAAIAATAISFAGCTTGTSDKADKKDDNVLFSTSFTMGKMGGASFTFKTDGTVGLECEQLPSLNTTLSWKYTDDTNTQITFNWGEDNATWNVKLAMFGDNIVSTKISSDSGLVDVRGPFIAYPDGVTAALTSTTDIQFTTALNGAPISLILFDKATATYKDGDGAEQKTNLICTYGENVYYNVSWSLDKDNNYAFDLGPIGKPVSTKTTESKYQSGKIGGMSFATFGLSTDVEFTQLQP